MIFLSSQYSVQVLQVARLNICFGRGGGIQTQPKYNTCYKNDAPARYEKICYTAGSNNGTVFSITIYVTPAGSLCPETSSVPVRRQYRGKTLVGNGRKSYGSYTMVTEYYSL